MQNKRTVVLWVMMAILMIYSPLFAQIKPDRHSKQGKSSRPEQPKPFEGWTEVDGLNYLDEMLTWGKDGPAVESICLELSGVAKLALTLQSAKMVQKIIDIPEFKSFNEQYPEYAFDVTEAKIRALGGFENYPGVREFVMQSLDHKSSGVQLVAASCVIGWGEWDLGAPIICRQEAYIVFQSRKDERAIPLLEDAVINGSWQGRIYAAAALFYTYGDSTKYPEVALDIILNAPINTDDENINRAKYLALQQVPRFNLLEALPGIIRNARDDDYGISSQAVGHLLHFSALGYQEATQVLMDIRDHHSNASIREQAKHGLLKLEQEQK